MIRILCSFIKGNCMWLLYVGFVLVLLYLFLIHPKNVDDQLWDGFRNYYYAHRGLFDNHTEAVENSLSAFRLAVENGYGIELDVQLTKDGVPIVFHDNRTGRLLRNQNGEVVNIAFGDIVLDDLRQYHLLKSSEVVPTLQEVLDVVDGKVPLIIELKVADERVDTKLLCEKTDEVLSRYQGLYCIESFHPICVNWYRINRPMIIRGQLADRPNLYARGKFLIASFIMQYLLTNFITRPNFIAYNHHYRYNVSRILCRILFKNPAIAWTIHSEKDLVVNRKHFDLFIFDGFRP
ncbi:MAG: glycerophosphodiester phosphodiesterase family protein [Bulleidia sp.]|nr:glycerophosphodiester phosphodiesterase family protein [Bulleidia sp.]